MEKIVSVIIPVYNSQKYLTKCLNSILCQTYKKLDIILINDGSDDLSGFICDAYSFNESNVRVIHTSNFGVSNARNIGIDNSYGDYIVFIDSDDWIDNLMIENLVENIQKVSNKLASCGYYLENEQGLLMKHSINEGIVDLTKESALNRFGSNPIPLWSILFPRWLFKKNRIRFREDIFISEDTLFIFECLANLDGIIYDSRPRYHYTFRDNSSSHSKFTTKNLTAYDAYESMLKITSSVSPISTIRVKVMIVSYTYLQILSILPNKKLSKLHLKFLRHKIYVNIKEYLNQRFIPLNAKLKVVLILIFPRFVGYLILVSKKIKKSYFEKNSL